MNSLSERASQARLAPLPGVEANQRVSLCEALDRMLTTGVVVAGEVVISVADVDLIYVNLQLLLSSLETASRQNWASPKASASS